MRIPTARTENTTQLRTSSLSIEKGLPGSGLKAWRRRGLVGGEAYQRAFDIVKQTHPGALRRPRPGDEYIVATGPPMRGNRRRARVPHPLFRPIARHRPADPLGGRKAQ